MAQIESKCRLIVVFLSVYLLSIGVKAGVAAIQKNQSELHTINRQINELKSKIEGDERLLKQERTDLQKIEKKILELNQQQDALKEKISQAKAKQNELKARADAERVKVAADLDRMGELVLSQHTLGEKGYLKLLLSQQEPAGIERTMVYYKYLAQFTSQKINQGRERVSELMVLEEGVNEHQQTLNQLLAQQRSQQAELASAKAGRQQVIAKLDNQLTKSANRIGRLQTDQKRIEKLVKGLQAAARARAKAKVAAAAKAAKAREKQASRPSPGKASSAARSTTVIRPVVQRVSNSGLGQLKGRLNMPVDGKIVARYGSAKQGSGVKWNGIMLDVSSGDPVRSIYDGQVVYADWFKGFGQLVIVDHGQGYMSLYSHNSQINQSLGANVKANEILAYAGTSGGLTEPGLYFEVRYNGEPRDPLLWVKH